MKANYSFPENLNAALIRPPFRLQIAFDGNWMDAWRFAPNAVPASLELKETLSGHEADVAVEFCFELKGGENFFFGQRRRGQKGDCETLEFVERALACGSAQAWRDFPEFLSRLEKAMPVSDHILQGVLCTMLDNVEIGITDWWARGDVVEVWNSKDKKMPPPRDFEAKLNLFPSLLSNTIKFPCLEFNFQTPLHHWFGIEISQTLNGVHYLQIERAHQLMMDSLAGLADLS